MARRLGRQLGCTALLQHAPVGSERSAVWSGIHYQMA